MPRSSDGGVRKMLSRMNAASFNPFREIIQAHNPHSLLRWIMSNLCWLLRKKGISLYSMYPSIYVRHFSTGGYKWGGGYKAHSDPKKVKADFLGKKGLKKVVRYPIEENFSKIFPGSLHDKFRNRHLHFSRIWTGKRNKMRNTDSKIDTFGKWIWNFEWK